MDVWDRLKRSFHVERGCIRYLVLLVATVCAGIVNSRQVRLVGSSCRIEGLTFK